MKTFIDAQKGNYGVEPICKVLPMAPSTYYRYAARLADPALQSRRWHRDAQLMAQIQAVWQANFQVYGLRKVWHCLRKQQIAVARCTVARLMCQLGLRGVIRGKTVRTTVSDKALTCPQDRVNRQFRAIRPNALWVSDFTFVHTWQGVVYVAFVIDVFARRIVGWRVSARAHTDFVRDALEQALHARCPKGGLTHHSDRGSQYVSLLYTQRLKDAGIAPSVGSTGDSYDNALAETINGLYKAEVIHRRAWPSLKQVELATLNWVHWYNHKRLLGSIGYRSPAQAEAEYDQQHAGLATVA